MDLPDVLYSASTWVIPILIAITFHEAAHAYTAWKLGDDTALRLGRVTFNPLKHVDPFGTILLPALLFLANAPFLFGWAKERPRGTRTGNCYPESHPSAPANPLRESARSASDISGATLF